MGLRKKTAQFWAHTVLPAVWKHTCRYDETVWIVGDGRSGTSWLSALINSGQCYRELFEPFHPLYAPDFQGYPLNSYVRPGAELSGPLAGFAERVFLGKVYSPWMDRNNLKLRYQRLLIKDVFANLFVAWIVQRFSHVKPVLLIRNPFAVALSKYKKRDWHWMGNPADFLNQPELMADWLGPFKELLEKPSADYVERQILIWCVLHYIPLQQFASGGIHTVFYENLFQNPAEEYSKIQKSLTLFAGPAEPDKSVISAPSCVAGTASTLRNGQSPLHSWKEELSAEQINNGMKILTRFHLDGLYGGESMPKPETLKDLSDA